MFSSTFFAATSDQSTGVKWYNNVYVVTSATVTSIGKGKSNTSKIVSVQGAGSYAAKICNDLVLNRYSDWFLPSRVELQLMYSNKHLIGNFVSVKYWSSSESPNSSARDYAGYVSFVDDHIAGIYKAGLCRVRAIRSFSH